MIDDAGFKNMIRRHIKEFLNEVPIGRREIVCRDRDCPSWAMYERAAKKHPDKIGMVIDGDKIRWRRLEPKPRRRLKFMTENRV